MKRAGLILCAALLAGCQWQGGAKSLPERVAETCLGYAGLTDFMVNARKLGKIGDESWAVVRPIGIFVGEQCSAQTQVATEDALTFLSAQINALIAKRAEVQANG